MKKILSLFLLLNVVRLFTSCLECDNEPVPFDFTSMQIKNLDNTDTFIRYSEGDSMKRNAVAFEIEVSTDRFRYTSNFRMNDIIGFSEALALEECPAKFRPRQRLENIEIISLTDISEELQANSNITNQVVAYQKNNSNLSYLYLTWDELYQIINPDLYYNEPVERFQVFLKPEVLTDSLQLAINVHLSDERMISDTTNVIHLY